MNSATIVQKLWNYCNSPRDDGMLCGDYVEQLAYLLFPKMADQRSKAPHNQKNPVPEQYSWPSLIKKDGDIIERYADGRERMLFRTVSQLEQACLGVSRNMVRRVLREQKAAGAVACEGRGPAARWTKKG